MISLWIGAQLFDSAAACGFVWATNISSQPHVYLIYEYWTIGRIYLKHIFTSHSTHQYLPRITVRRCSSDWWYATGIKVSVRTRSSRLWIYCPNCWSPQQCIAPESSTSLHGVIIEMISRSRSFVGHQPHIRSRGSCSGEKQVIVIQEFLHSFHILCIFPSLFIVLFYYTTLYCIIISMYGQAVWGEPVTGDSAVNTASLPWRWT